MTDQTIKISGKCASDDIASCEFRIRRVGAVIRAQGQKELADAIEQAANRVRKARAKEPISKRLTITDPTLGESHNVSIPLSCPGTQPVPPQLAKALAESEEM